MTTYNPISDAELVSGQPVTTSLMTRLRDNMTATIEGDLSAPLVLLPVPRNKLVFLPSASDQTWTNTLGKTVRLYVMLKGAGGGATGFTGLSWGPGANGGSGAVLFATFLVEDGETITMRVGGGGLHGSYTSSFYQNGGGGGGGGSRLIYVPLSLTLVAGGGSGGSGRRDGGSPPCYGGAGGLPGAPIGGVGGAAGIGGITANGGAAGSSNDTNGFSGTSSAVSEFFEYLFMPDGITAPAGGIKGAPTGAAGNGGDGAIILRW